MVLYNDKARIDFIKYGIGIPSLSSRKTNTIEALRNDPILSELRDKWDRSEIPHTISRKDLERAHDPAYIAQLYGTELEQHLIDTYELVDEQGKYNRYDPESATAPLVDILDSVMSIIDGTYEAIHLGLKEGFAYYLGGGMHHAHPHFGHGFCLLNDICVAMLKAQKEGLFQKAWIIDVDAHKGDGSAEILGTHSDIKTLSIHMAKGWPLDKPQFQEDGSINSAWYPSDVDIPMEEGEEEAYTARLIKAMERLEIDFGKPDFVYVVAGVDPYEKDELPSTDPINLTKAQLLERDQSIYKFLDSRSIPSTWCSAGGYGRFSWEIHTAFLNWVLKKRLA